MSIVLRNIAQTASREEIADLLEKLNNDNARMRATLEETLAVIDKLARFAEAYEPRTRNTEVEQLDALKRGRALLANDRPPHE